MLHVLAVELFIVVGDWVAAAILKALVLAVVLAGLGVDRRGNAGQFCELELVLFWLVLV